MKQVVILQMRLSYTGGFVYQMFVVLEGVMFLYAIPEKDFSEMASLMPCKTERGGLYPVIQFSMEEQDILKPSFQAKILKNNYKSKP